MYSIDLLKFYNTKFNTGYGVAISLESNVLKLHGERHTHKPSTPRSRQAKGSRLSTHGDRRGAAANWIGIHVQSGIMSRVKLSQIVNIMNRVLH